jgi:excisionase family DNA binding protein
MALKPVSRSPMLSVQQVASRLSVSSKTVRRQIASGRLQVFRVGGQIRVSEEQLALHLATHGK